MPTCHVCATVPGFDTGGRVPGRAAVLAIRDARNTPQFESDRQSKYLCTRFVAAFCDVCGLCFGTPPQRHYAAVKLTFSFDVGTFLPGHYCKTCRTLGELQLPGPASKRWRANLFYPVPQQYHGEKALFLTH